MTKISIFLNFFFGFFELLVTFELFITLSKDYCNPIGLERTFSGHRESFQRIANGLIVFDTFFSHFSTEF